MTPSLNIPYSAQYSTITREGHERPTPIFGTPTLVWHLGISPHWEDEHPQTSVPVEALHKALSREYEETRAGFFEGINRLLVLLQQRARLPRAPGSLKLDVFKPDTVPPPWKLVGTLGEPFHVTSPTDIRFTLWWHDAPPTGNEPAEDALRVKVHAAAHRDFVAVSLYIDAGKPWNKPESQLGQPVVGTRRQRIFREVGSIRSTCESRLVAQSGSPLVEREVLPEEGVSGAEAEALMRASRYLYSGIWDEFCADFGIADLNELLGKDSDGNTLLGAGRVFANFRGLVLATPGLDAPVQEHGGASGTRPFPRFVGNGGIDASGVSSAKEVNEANAVVKAFWPFVRRITPFADQREFVACGLMSWRALYITALGSPRAFDWPEEGKGSSSFIPAGHLPEDFFDDAGRYDSITGYAGEGPLRYLFLTKGEPHRRQIGRIVERINTLGTLRLVALRDWTIIRDASTQIQLRGLELDTIMQRWSEGSRKIRENYEDKVRRRPCREDKYGDQRDQALQTLATEIEKDLIYLSAALDKIGLAARHGLHFRINRSRYYVEEFETLLRSLKVGNIDTWVAYDQFVSRGLKPAFDFIDGVGNRLLGLRSRLQSVLEGIETSALVIQTSATRSNTAQLKRIARTFRINNILVGLVGGALTYFASGGSLQDAWLRAERVWAAIWAGLRFLLDKLSGT